MSRLQFPLSLALYWGLNPDREDTATEVSFDNEEDFQAFRAGLDAVDGWQEATFVENGAYYANKDGDFLQRAGANTQSSPSSRYVLWGDPPEPGTRAQVFNFDTPSQARAFQAAVEAGVGWDKYCFVPSADFKPYASLAAALPHLTDEGRAAVEHYAAAEQIELDDDDAPVYVRADGALVRPDYWDLADPIPNAPLRLGEFRTRFLDCLTRVYAVNAKQIDALKEPMEQRFLGPDSRLPEACATQLAHEMGLPQRVPAVASRPLP
jgi:hypothetical protein